MCEHHEQLQRVSHELELMWGNGEISYARLKNLLTQALEQDHT